MFVFSDFTWKQCDDELLLIPYAIRALKCPLYCAQCACTCLTWGLGLLGALVPVAPSRPRQLELFCCILDIFRSYSVRKNGTWSLEWTDKGAMGKWIEWNHNFIVILLFGDEYQYRYRKKWFSLHGWFLVGWWKTTIKKWSNKWWENSEEGK